MILVGDWYPGKPGRPPKNAADLAARLGQEWAPSKPAAPPRDAPPVQRGTLPTRPSLRAALAQAAPEGAVTPDAVIPPLPPATDGPPSFLGPGWKRLVSGLAGDQLVNLLSAHIRKGGHEPSEVDEDNLQAFKTTLEQTIHRFAPALEVPWWVALPLSALFVFLDLRTTARAIEVVAAAPAVPQPKPDAPPPPAAAAAAAAPPPPEPEPIRPVFPSGPSKFARLVVI